MKPVLIIELFSRNETLRRRTSNRRYEAENKRGDVGQRGKRTKTQRRGTEHRVCSNVRKMTRGQSVERAPHILPDPLEKESRIRKDVKVC